MHTSEEKDEDRFWSLIEHTIPFSGEQNQQMNALKVELRKLTMAQIERFARTFESILYRSYSWDLWGAAFVIMGGASDDGFEYFRVWMVSRGRSFFETAERDPDALASLIPAEYHDVPEFELLAYVAREVWEEKSGRQPVTEFVQPNMIYGEGGPKGQPFKEDEKHLSERYPKLWARFGRSPLG